MAAELAFERIGDPEDPRIAPFRNVRERDAVGREGRFIAEGKVVLSVLFEARRFEVESALILDSRLEGMHETLAKAPRGMPVYVAEPSVMDRIAGFHIHRGILAAGLKRVAEPVESLLANLPERALVVVLVGIANHDNVGAIFRNAAAFGADAVLLDATSCDPLYRKAIRVSVGAALKVPYTVAQNAEDMLAALDGAGFTAYALSPAGKASVRNAERPGRVALIVGSEGSGLPDTIMERARTMRIPMAPGLDSLNVATAAAIALHEMWEPGEV
jgi:tRNA G18 (ribose-2'-O)-methylase SpoU